MPQFVILMHDWPSLHWDFLVEADHMLRAWRLLTEPCPNMDLRAEPNANHRMLYLDYEGPVSGGRGSVSRWDSGSCEWHMDEIDRVEIELCGAKLSGLAVIQCLGNEWRFRLTERH